MRILITGGAGFIGSAVIRRCLEHTKHSVVNVDKLTYASRLASHESFEGADRYSFEKADICDHGHMSALFAKHKPNAVMHLAAESHVDRSIDKASEFIQTNIIGTHTLLECAVDYWRTLDPGEKEQFRFHHVSTDEVYGSLGMGEDAFTEETPYAPNSPYSSSKASSDLLARAWHHTYDLPVVTSNCSNNYGPFQYPEKLIPVVILAALDGREIPVYGDGKNVRDWLYVDDHAAALLTVLERGSLGQTYNIGSNTELSNLTLVESICKILDRLLPESPHKPHLSLLEFVTDRPGHDLRYAVDASKITRTLGWKPATSLDAGLETTVAWYIANYDRCVKALEQ